MLCPDAFCPFGPVLGPAEPDQRGLPVLVVDEEIYRHPPSLLIGTVDKFAQLPWRGETPTLFGRVTRRCERHGYCSRDDLERADWELSHPPGAPGRAGSSAFRQARPPDLIIQDELHLISGPLGSLVGLYETAVDRLGSPGKPKTAVSCRPKVIASTATVRRASRQIRALFHRRTEVFPPPGLTWPTATSHASGHRSTSPAASTSASAPTASGSSRRSSGSTCRFSVRHNDCTRSTGATR